MKYEVNLIRVPVSLTADQRHHTAGSSMHYELDAKALCSACPVRSDCLLYGLDEPTGIWGGRTARERRFIRRRLRGAAS